MHGIWGAYRVQIRRGPRRAVRPEAEQLDGKVFEFRPGYTLTSEDHSQYAGELAMIPIYDSVEYPYPLDAPHWLASGDMVLVAEKQWPRPPVDLQPELSL